jgi:hypothetical protein
MPIEENQASDGGGYSEEYMVTDPTGVYVGMNEDAVYLDPDWEYPEVINLLDDDSGTPFAAGRGNMSTVNRSNGYATVRLNSPATFSGSVPFNGNVSGVLPAGTLLRGKDSNNNGVPDLLEKQLKKGRIKF